VTRDETPLGPGGCCDRQPLRRCPSATVFSTSGRVGESASDVLCRARWLIAGRSLRSFLCDAPWTPGLLPSSSRQRRRFPPARTPSIDECSLCPLSLGIGGNPPPFSRLRRRDPASGARSPLHWGEARPAAMGGRPSAARRLLQSIQSASTTARSSEPRSAYPESTLHVTHPLRGEHRSLQLSLPRRTPTRPEPCRNRTRTELDQPSRDALSGWIRPLRSDSNRGFTGQGPDGLSSFRRPPSRLLAAEASPRPDRLGHLLSRARDDLGRRGQDRQADT
jgi:hypothetical protein